MRLTTQVTLILFCVCCGNRIKTDLPTKPNLVSTKDTNIHKTSSITWDSIKSYSAKVIDFDCKGIPDSVWQMKNLKYLGIYGEDCDYGPVIKNGKEVCCGIDYISPKIGQLKELQQLSIHINPISSLPDEIKQCKKLKEIDLTDCTINTIDNLTGLTDLEQLSLFGCHIEKLPTDIGKLKNLKYLGLSGNWQITDDEIKRVKKALPHCEIIFER